MKRNIRFVGVIGLCFWAAFSRRFSGLELISVRLLVTCSLARNGEGGRSHMPMWATSGDKTIEVMLNLFRSAGCRDRHADIREHESWKREKTRREAKWIETVRVYSSCREEEVARPYSF